MSYLITQWVHQPGRHCASSAIRDIMEYYGYPVSEASCFGLGAGLGFFYFHNPEASPSHSIMVRSAGLEREFFNSIEAPFSWRIGDPAALDSLKKHIVRNIPAILQTDIFYIDYYQSQTHFAGHVITVWGFDDKREVVFVSDTTWPGLLELSYDSLEKAWSSSTPPFYIDHNYAPVLRPERIDMEKAIKKSLLTQARDMLSAGIGDPPIERMKLLASKFPEWAGAHDWKWCARFAYQVIERRGTGGGGFRIMYAEFLREVRKSFPDIITHKMSFLMAESARLWSRLAMLLKEISESPEPYGFDEAGILLGAIAEKEEEFYTSILESKEVNR